MSAENKPLTVNVRNGEMVIRIGVNVLASAIANRNDAHNYNAAKDQYIRNFAIVDPKMFAADVKMAMEKEKEDGSSPLSDFLDEMGQAAIDDGSMGVEYDQRIVYGKKSKREKW